MKLTLTLTDIEKDRVSLKDKMETADRGCEVMLRMHEEEMVLILLQEGKWVKWCLFELIKVIDQFNQSLNALFVSKLLLLH